jgi:hypothetical protein
MHTRFLPLLALALLVGVAMPAQAQRIFFHGVSIYDRTAAAFSVNGFHFRVVAATDQPLTTADLTPYLIKGPNELKWHFSGQPAAGLPSLFRFRLQRKTEGIETVAEAFTFERFVEFQQEGEPPNVIDFFAERLLISPVAGFRHELRTRRNAGEASRAVIDLDLPESRLAPLAADPGDVSIKTTLPDAVLLSLPWQGAPIELTDPDRQEIRALVAAMQAAFVARDGNALADLQTLRIQRFAAARGQTEEQFRADLLESYAPIFGPPGFVFDPLDPTTLTLTSYPDANLVQVEKAGEPPIRATGAVNDAQAVFKVPIYVSKVGGVWRIVD